VIGRAARDALPHLDEHAVEVAADRERVWEALLSEFPRGLSSTRGASTVAALLGCRERSRSGALDQPGSTLVGFRVARAEHPMELGLAGEHRFSRYALNFIIEDLGGDRGSLLRASTDAAFPGLPGRAYRALVVSSGAHARMIRAMLARVRSRAEGIERPFP
jgi:hypothetical protein